jgi:hypothetical protein
MRSQAVNYWEIIADDLGKASIFVLGTKTFDFTVLSRLLGRHLYVIRRDRKHRLFDRVKTYV